jgi:hypothetical protein
MVMATWQRGSAAVFPHTNRTHDTSSNLSQAAPARPQRGSAAKAGRPIGMLVEIAIEHPIGRLSNGKR